MSDEELRALERAATEVGDAPSWLRLAQAHARAGKGDEAGRAANRARGLGEDPFPVLDALAPSLETFSMRELGERFELEKLWYAAWSPDAKTIYALENKRVIHAVDAASGTRKTVLILLGEASAFAADPDGERLALGLQMPQKGKIVSGLGLVDPVAGKLETVGRGHGWIHQVALTKDTILCAEKERLRGYRFYTDREKSSLSLKGCPALDATGAFAITLGTALHLHSQASKEPRATVHLDIPAGCFGTRFHLACAGERTVVVADDVVLLERTGAVLARAKLPAPHQVYDIVASPSGRHVAFFWAVSGQRTTRVDLLDVVQGSSRVFELGGRPRWASWSPSGQRLAIPTDQGTIVLLEAPSGPALPEEKKERKPAVEGGWIELRSSERFWRGRRHGALIEFHHGLLGTRGTRGATPFAGEEAAKRALARRIKEKEESGYERAPAVD